MNTAETNLNPAAAGLPTERELLNLAAELLGEAPVAPVEASGTDWAQIAADVLREQSASASSEAYSPTLVSAKNAADVTPVRPVLPPASTPDADST